MAQSGDSPLHVAAYYRHAGVMKVLLEQGANVAATTTVVSRREQVQFHDSAADACARHQAKEQALHIAAKAGSASCVEQLLNHGATVNARTVVCTPQQVEHGCALVSPQHTLVVDCRLVKRHCTWHARQGTPR